MRTSIVSDFFRQCLAGLKLLLVMTVVLGVLYPAAVWGAGQVAFHDRANGQIITAGGAAIGSRLIGQDFPVGAPGGETAQWFHGRPSMADYDGLASGPSNLGPSNPDLLATIRDRQKQIAAVEGVPTAQIPADAVTASASGLDPYISPAYAALQIDRVARERSIPVPVVKGLVDDATRGRQLGFLGQPKVNVLELNLAIARQ